MTSFAVFSTVGGAITFNEIGSRANTKQKLVKNGNNRGNRATIKRSFIAECWICHKWRKLGNKAEYSKFLKKKRTNNPFSCQHVNWGSRKTSCNAPSDVVVLEDRTIVWIVEENDVPIPPPGWLRLVKKRKIVKKKFADVYYLELRSNKKFRSSVEIRKYLAENPQNCEHGGDDVSLSQFCFTSPTALKSDRA